MRLPAWLLWAATAVVTIISAEDTALVRVKRKSQEKKIVCYYTNWSVYRPGTAKFSPQNINPYLCTHLIYAFGGLTKDNSLKPFDKYQDIEQGGYAKFNGLKTYNKNLKTLVAIGGWNEGSARFSPLVADSERRRELVKNTIKFLRQNHFDGLDLDWEYPSFRDGGKPRDRDNYAALVQELREEFDRESAKTGRTRLLLTMAVPAGIEYIDKGYDIPRLNKYLDWMNILSYDYHSAFEPTVNHHAPLFSLEEDDEYNFDAQLNIDHTVQHYLKLGADRNKLVLGIPTYGRSYTLFNPEANEIGAAADGPGEQGEATREKGYLAYYEICERIKGGDWEVKNDHPEAMGPYAYKGNQWVGYDDEEIAKAKAKYVNDNDLGGIMFWSIDNDDFRGKCHGKPYPLIEAAKESLLATSNELVPARESGRSSSRQQEVEHTTKAKSRKTRPRAKTTTTTTTESSRTRTTPVYTTTTPVPPTTPDPGSDFVCKDEGFFPHPRDCKKYFWCLDSGPSSLGIVAHQFTCPSGLVFNKISDSCDYARNVICKNKAEVTTTTTTTTTSKSTTSRSNVITASPPRSTSTTTTTTTTEEPEYEEYEEEEEEDPGTIKELISLIKKLGGVEQLEKQLNLQDENIKYKPSLYNKLISGRAGNKFRGAGEETSTSKYVSLFRNRPAGGQSPSNEETDKSSSSKHHEKPQYVTINRSRSTTKAPKEEETEEEEDEEEIEEETIKEEAPKPKSSRRRPSSDASTEKEYVTLRRQKAQKDESTTPRYKSILRTRSTTESTVEEEEDSEEEIVSDEKQSDQQPEKERKYSSVIRDNKRVNAEADESKVSGGRPRGPQYQRESSITTPTTSEPVNNVHTTLKYVEIRRGHSTTTEAESLTDNVNNVNIKKVVQESSEEKGAITENDLFQRRTDTTTELNNNRKRTRVTFKTVEQTTPFIVEAVKPVTRSRGRFRIVSSTEPSTTTTTKSSQTRRRGGFNRSSTTTEAVVTEAPKRFKFPPRAKPVSRSQKVYDNKTGEYFTVVFPETTEYPNSAELTTLDVTETVTEPDTTETDLPLTTLQRFKPTRLPKASISTSTETSVVTSITESLFTERLKISVTKKPIFKVKSKTTEKPRVTSTELPRSRFVKSSRTTPKVETTTTVKPTRGFRSRSRVAVATTTQAPETTTVGERKFVPKKSRGYQKFTDSGSYESSDSVEVESIERNNRFRPRGRSKSQPSDTLFKRTGEIRGRRKQNDDLDTQQSGAFYDDDIDLESDQKFLLGGTVKQTSGKDFLNADVLFVTVPSIEDEEKNSIATESELLKSTLPSRSLNKSKEKSRSFRGRVRAKESLTNELEGGNSAETEASEAPSTTAKSTSFRRGNQEYLNNLRGKARSTTQAPTTTERPTRRPGQNDRRRFRPETRTSSTTSKSDLTATNSTRNYQFPKRRTRPTTSTTEAASISEQNDSKIEESKDTSDLPDLADPAVVAIHNLATVSPGPAAPAIATTPIRVFSESQGFTIHVSPVTETSFSPSLRPVSTPSNLLSSKHTSLRPFISSTTRQYPSSSTQYSTRTPSTPIQVTPISQITDEPLIARTEVVIQPRRQDTLVRQRTTTVATATPKQQTLQPRRLKPFSKVPKAGVVQAVGRPDSQQSPEYEYYDDADVVDDPLADVPPSALKVKVHSDGYIECLDRGNFPHPFSCKKFISCAKMENNELLGWEYTCPKHLSFDPVGGICNWSAGLGCQH